MKKIIAFDVDDTLIIPPEATGLDRDVPNYETIAIYRWFQAQGHHMIVWSGGGVSYAEMWADKLGLKPDEIREKKNVSLCSRHQEVMKGCILCHAVDIAFDDCDVDLATVNIKVKRMNNSVKRTIPTKRNEDTK